MTKSPQLNFFCAFLNWDSQQGRDLTRSGHNKKKSIGPILFLYYEESLLSSSLNSKLFWFHCVRPNTDTFSIAYSSFSSVLLKVLFRTFQYERPCMRIERYYIPDFFFISFLTSISANCVRVVSSVMLDKDWTAL